MGTHRLGALDALDDELAQQVVALRRRPLALCAMFNTVSLCLLGPRSPCARVRALVCVRACARVLGKASSKGRVKMQTQAHARRHARTHLVDAPQAEDKAMHTLLAAKGQGIHTLIRSRDP